ncbi:MAG: iron-sulfur cluster assembly scaffold protein [Candidatus Helarchaeota archaeon]
MKSSDEEFERFINELQEEIYQDEIKDFSRKIVEEYHHPKNWGRMQDADTYAIYKGPCGDTQEIYLKITGKIITKATFVTDGCGPTVACGSKLTTLITNKSIYEAKAITPEDLDKALDGLPEDHKHCALLAVTTLRKAIENILDRW